MKKYHLADVLTALEVICAVILLVMAFGGGSADLAVFVFAFGEVCDAFDGICARKWHYPDDGKERWWRVYAAEIDKISDIMLIVAVALYFAIALNKFYFVSIGAGMGIFCTIVELFTRDMDESSRVRTAVILFRRYVYLGCVALAGVTLIFATSWPSGAKTGVTAFCIVAGIALLFIKKNRLTQDKTPL